MSTLHVVLAIGAAVVLFLFGIEHFSKEVQAVAGERFRRFLARGTRHPWQGFLLGAIVTAVIQSSSATSVIAVGLVNAGVLSFRNSLGVIFGANVGTTVTAQLVAMKLTAFAPALILVGFVTGLLPFRWRVLGRTIFYFGVVFFSLELVAQAVAPLGKDPEVVAMLTRVEHPLVGLALGAALTALLQSSSVMTGMAVVLLSQGVIGFGLALPLVIGANIGTTITALLASAQAEIQARRTALSHALYNVGGAMVFVPFLGLYGDFLLQVPASPEERLALAHVAFNAVTASLFLAGVKPFATLVERLVPDDAEREEPLEAPDHRLLAVDPGLARVQCRAFVAAILGRMVVAYAATVLALQTGDRKHTARARRLGAIVRIGLGEGAHLVNAMARGALGPESSRMLLGLVISLDHVRQLADSVDDLRALHERLEAMGQPLTLEATVEVQRVFPLAQSLLEALHQAHVRPPGPAPAPGQQEALAPLAEEMEQAIARSYGRFLEIVHKSAEGSELADFLSVHQRLRTKVLAFWEHLEEERGVTSLGVDAA